MDPGSAELDKGKRRKESADHPREADAVEEAGDDSSGDRKGKGGHDTPESAPEAADRLEKAVGGANRGSDEFAAVAVVGGSRQRLIGAGSSCLDVIVQRERLISWWVGVLDHGKSGENAVQGVGNLCIDLLAGIVLIVFDQHCR